jgi:prolyl-tRNA editing enzyme YbaK/EbsC (Cys-tRNA(Pro) deacylase)
MALSAMWPEPVERIAGLLRAAHVEGRIEELAPGVDSPPGTVVFAEGFEADGARVVALVPTAREVDRDKLAAAAKSSGLRPAPAPEFPFEPARVVLDRSLLAAPIVWLAAGSGRHVVAIAPQHLVRLTRAETADLLVDQ